MSGDNNAHHGKMIAIGTRNALLVLPYGDSQQDKRDGYITLHGTWKGLHSLDELLRSEPIPSSAAMGTVRETARLNPQTFLI